MEHLQHKVKYQRVNNHIDGSLNLTSRKSMLGDFMRDEIQRMQEEIEPNSKKLGKFKLTHS